MRASADPVGSPARALGEAELDNIKVLRMLAEKHVREALSAAGNDHEVLMAASTPDEFIDLSWVDQFGYLAEDLWDNGFELARNTFQARAKTPMPPRSFMFKLASDAIEDSRQSYLDLLRALIQKHAYPLAGEPVYGEFRSGSAVQYGDVRGLLTKLGGGTADPEVPISYGGVTTGRIMQDYLAETGINSNQKIWLYGWEEQPRRTFNGHLQMDGLVFEDWDDNGLIIAPQDRWLRRNYYAPGDHWGCACVVSPYFPNMGEEFEI